MAQAKIQAEKNNNDKASTSFWAKVWRPFKVGFTAVANAFKRLGNWFVGLFSGKKSVVTETQAETQEPISQGCGGCKSEGGICPGKKEGRELLLTMIGEANYEQLKDYKWKGVGIKTKQELEFSLHDLVTMVPEQNSDKVARDRYILALDLASAIYTVYAKEMQMSYMKASGDKGSEELEKLMRSLTEREGAKTSKWMEVLEAEKNKAATEVVDLKVCTMKFDGRALLRETLPMFQAHGLLMDIQPEQVSFNAGVEFSVALLKQIESEMPQCKPKTLAQDKDAALSCIDRWFKTGKEFKTKILSDAGLNVQPAPTNASVAQSETANRPRSVHY
ncbi:MAG: hypothetical protein V4490_07285 [Pseudomonadota bacterium]